MKAVALAKIGDESGCQMGKYFLEDLFFEALSPFFCLVFTLQEELIK